jgi:flagellar biosynthesis protein FlhG
MNPYILAICSGKGGVGKSVIAANVATILSAKYKTLLIDTDIMFPNCHLMLGVEPHFRLDDWFYNNVEISRVIAAINENFGLIAGANNSNNYDLQQNFSLMDLLHSVISNVDYDFIIIDTNAGLSDCLIEAVSIADKCAIVITEEPTSVVDGYGLIKLLNNYTDYRKINAIINNTIDYEDAEEVINKLNMATKHFLDISVDVLGVVMYDNAVRRSIIDQKVLCMTSPELEIVKSFVDISNNLVEISSKV